MRMFFTRLFSGIAILMALFGVILVLNLIFDSNIFTMFLIDEHMARDGLTNGARIAAICGLTAGGLYLFLLGSKALEEKIGLLPILTFVAGILQLALAFTHLMPGISRPLLDFVYAFVGVLMVIDSVVFFRTWECCPDRDAG